MLGYLLLSALAVTTFTAAAQAQQESIGVPYDIVQSTRQFEGSQLTFCLNVHSAFADFDRAVASSLAEALLLEPAFYEVDPPRTVAPLDYAMPLTMQEVFVFLNEECDAFIGWALSPTGHRDWLTVTRPYYETTTVLATTNVDIDSLGEVPREETIGIRMFSNANFAFTAYRESLPGDETWEHVAPYPYDEIMVQRLQDGTLEVAFIWNVALMLATDHDPEAVGIRVISSEPLTLPIIDFGIALRSADSYVRTLLDDAITALVDDGTITELLEQYGLPGAAATASQ